MIWNEDSKAIETFTAKPGHRFNSFHYCELGQEYGLNFVYLWVRPRKEEGTSYIEITDLYSQCIRWHENNKGVVIMTGGWS
jgi:hypothetical protein